jgi:hypothetical protein
METRWTRIQVLLASIVALLQNAMRGAVRCVFPVFCLAVFALFVWAVPQGQDVLLGLVERAAGGSVAGVIWLGGSVTALSLSIWYSMRWLLTAPMPGLPFDDSPGWVRRWLPRISGALPAAIVASSWLQLDDLQTYERANARLLAVAFSALALVLLLSFAGRGWLMGMLVRLGWMAPPRGRRTSVKGIFEPSQLGADEPLPWVTQVIVGWGLMLSVLLTLLITRFPVGVPEDIGAAAIAGFALASINLSGSFLLTLWPLRHGVPHLAPWVLLLAGVFGAFNDNHVVTQSPLAEVPNARPTLQQAFARHLQSLRGSDRPAVVFVASEGGGIRAAFWTAQVLEELAREVPEWPMHTFAISGVSGGSLGLASWLAVERSRRCPQARHNDIAGLAWGGADRESVRRRLGADFLAPPVAGMLFYDLIQRFWPWPIELFDRSRAIEQAWQRAHSHLPGRPFERPLEQWYEGCEGLPDLMLNATVVETGQRAVLTRLDPGEAFINDFRSGTDDLMSARFSAAEQSTAGLVHHSARFPALSPGGTIERAGPPISPALRLVDGGYFDNSGAQTVADLVETLCRISSFRPIVLLVRNAPEELNGCQRRKTASGRLLSKEECQRGETTPGPLFPEVGSIIGGLYNARSAHAVAARLALQGRLDADLIDVAVPADAAAADAPLGWALSSRAQARYEVAARDVARAVGVRLRDRLGAASNGCERVRETTAKDAR